jgi:hypothetical protein
MSATSDPKGVRVVCARCGGERFGLEAICPGCGLVPEGEGLLVAWLLSDEHLAADELERVSARIRAGESIRPSAAQLQIARRMLGADWTSDPGLTSRQRLALVVGSVVLTPLAAWVLAGWWWWERPRAARQALLIAVPTSALGAVGALVVRFT